MKDINSNKNNNRHLILFQGRQTSWIGLTDALEWYIVLGIYSDGGFKPLRFKLNFFEF